MFFCWRRAGRDLGPRHRLGLAGASSCNLFVFNVLRGPGGFAARAHVSAPQITKDILSLRPAHGNLPVKAVSVIDIQLEDKAGSRFIERERRTKRRFLIEQEVRYKMLYGQRIRSEEHTSELQPLRHP